MTKTTENGWAGSKADWKKRAGPHNITLKSGQKLTIKVYGVGELLLLGAIPEDLRDTVGLHLINRHRGGIDAVIGAELLELNGSDPTKSEKFQQRLRDAARLTKTLVLEALRPSYPDLTLEELDEFPWDDLEELMRLCTGQEAFDSRGVRVGVERIDSWATFQDEHRDGPCLVEGCERCARAREALSSLHLVSV